MKNIRFVVLLPALSATLFSCLEEINLDHLRPESKLVLNCTAIAGYPATAYVSRTWFYTDGQSNLNIENAEVRLYVNDGLQETMSLSQETANRLGACFLSEYIPRSGDRLKVIASVPEYSSIEATTELPEPPVVSDVSLSHKLELVDNSSALYTYCNSDIELTLHDKPSEENYYLVYFQMLQNHTLAEKGDTIYKWESCPLDYGNDPLLAGQISALDRAFGYTGSSYSGGVAFTDELIGGKSYTLHLKNRIYTSYWGPGNPSVPGYGEGHTHKFRLYLYTISRSYYFYLKTLQMARDGSFSGDLADIGLAEPIRIYSNVAGGTGVLGGATPQMWEFQVDED